MNERPGQCGAERMVIAMDLTERTLESRSIFEGKIVTLLVDRRSCPDGKQASREVVLHPGGVAVLPLDEKGNVTLVQQYRYPFHQIILELPAGKLDAGEPHRDGGAAGAERGDRAGGGGADLSGVPAGLPGFCNERLHLYLARGLSRAESHPDDDEFLNVVTMPFDRAAGAGHGRDHRGRQDGGRSAEDQGAAEAVRRRKRCGKDHPDRGG